MNQKTKVLFKPIEWFKENAHKDHDGDFWKLKEYKVFFDKFHQNHPDSEHLSLPMYYKYASNPKDIDDKKIDQYMWAIDRILNKQADPEYYLI